MKTTIIVAAGKGLRMKTETPKQFLELEERPVLMHTLEAFVQADSTMRIILVLPKEQFSVWEHLCALHSFRVEHQQVAGGESRFQSVKNGLDLAPDEGYIAIHDGVRPYIQPETINRIFREAEIHGNAIPALQPAESVRLITEKGNQIIDRNSLRLIQTPQIFEAKKLKAAYNQAKNTRFTDDASVYEANGNAIHLVDGQAGNLKITLPGDL